MIAEHASLQLDRSLACAALEASEWVGPQVWIHDDAQPTNLLVQEVC